MRGFFHGFDDKKIGKFMVLKTKAIEIVCRVFVLVIFSSLIACGGTGVEDGGAEDGGSPDTIILVMGSGNGDGFVAGMLSALETNLAAGSTTTITASLVDSSSALTTEDVAVTFTSPCIASGLSTISEPALRFVNGVASLEYTSNGCAGSDIVTASSTVNEAIVVASVELIIEPDSVLSMAFVGAEPAQLALRGTGGVETTTVTFKLIGVLGAAIPGETVTFDISSTVGGVSIATGKESGITNTQGEVSTVIQAGTVSTSVSVSATHDVTGIKSSSDSIVISSGAPVDSKFSLALTTSKPSNAFNTNGVEVGVSIIASDYFGNDVPDGTQVFFASPESGNIDSSCEIISGECSVIWTSAGARPSNLRATILAYTPGAEDYLDINGNNVYDAADIFDVEENDLAEPYADENENGEYEPGELFVDTNENQMRDSGNMLWDGPCLAAADSSADCSGSNTVNIWRSRVLTFPTNNVELVSSEMERDNSSNWTAIAPGSTIATTANNRVKLRFVMADDNLQTAERIALPTGTTIITSMDKAEYNVTGQTEITIGSEQVYASEYTVSIFDEDITVDNPERTLNVEVSVPGSNPTTFTWYINDTVELE